MNSNWSWQAAMEGMSRAARAANPEWAAFMAALIIEIARRQEYFYTDDVERERRVRNGPETHEQRAIGPLMAAAARAGVMTPTRRFISGRWSKQIWHSQIYQGNTVSRPPPRWARPANGPLIRIG